MVEPISLVNGSSRRPFFGSSARSVILTSAGPGDWRRPHTSAADVVSPRD